MPWIRKIHKWASVVVGIQFLLWLLSGIYFNVMDHTKAAGNTYKSHTHQKSSVSQAQLVELKTVLATFKASNSIEQTFLLGKPYYLLTHEPNLYKNFKHNYTLVDAYSGEQVNINSDFAKALAINSYSGPGKTTKIKLVNPPIDDFPKEKNAAWQVDFSDDINTSVYVELGSGRIVGHSDEHKRLADIFFMIHFMDYANEGSFNSLLMIMFAFITLWLSLTGLIWTIDLGLRGQYQIKFFAKKQGVRLFDKHQKSMGEVTLSSHTNLLDGLIEHNIALPSTCGGGGTCGRCKVMINPIVNATSADSLHFSEEELQQGYRLACQHFSNDVKDMTLIDITDAKKHNLALKSCRFISPHIKELRFKVCNGSSLTYKAGAFMRFLIPAAKGESIPCDLPNELKSHWEDVEFFEFNHLACTRSYSLAEPSLENDELVFTIKIQAAPNTTVLPGVGSSYLCNLMVGAEVEAIGPFEEFFVKEPSKNTMVLLGAGSGMAPLKAIIEEQIQKNNHNDEDKSECSIHFFYGARKECDLLYEDHFYQLADMHKYFHYYPTLSQADENWLGATGYAQDILGLNLDNLGPLENIDFYLCGPDGLMKETIKLLKARGVKDSAIAFDEFV
ncbi:2Fe-2S iron-sulfur cluster binding domain-containing protein [Thalassotalea piscium]|uniref:Na(+)-translocating NADH:ubiquinone oxidoreductase F subunit n=1 Tax=Thalassotalea piscium TaxID=1230533 RepID=A0A7X0NFP0_9GAMM|nr:2Fe-2S iron-sulfur cluster binding domain-containing protein [Thalassotalea piscium]MBB6542525.1 Na(+)-translocating NADH:ubiquinone oxidoreductase F subunit [Thalassotalea piscium]